MLSGLEFGIFDVAHPIYVESLLAINGPVVVEVKERSLRKVKEAFDRQSTIDNPSSTA
jgi:hypothetical protein